jgi:hypothetical protein
MLLGNVGRKALVTLVTCEASKLQRIASYKNEVTDEAVSGFKIR